jgi:hypothetical protein
MGNRNMAGRKGAQAGRKMSGGQVGLLVASLRFALTLFVFLSVEFRQGGVAFRSDFE